MEQKTVEQYLREKGIHPTEPIYWDLANKTISLNELLDDYAKQQQEIAVDKALEMCSSLSKEMIYDRDNLKKEESKGLILRNFQVCYATSKQEILSLKPEILKELEK